MLDKETIIKVKNRTDRKVGYTIPELNVRRQFQPGAPKDIKMDELRQLSYLPGGEYILKNYLQLNNAEAVEELIGEVEPEYYYTKNQIVDLLNNGTLDELKDCLDFAPSGVLDLIKEVAIETELNDVRKREAIFEQTGLNINKAIEFNKETKEEEVSEKKTRRVKSDSTESELVEETPKGRRTSLPKYKVAEK